MVRRMVVVAVALVMAMAATAHAQYRPGQPGFEIDPAVLPCEGGPATISGVNLAPASTASASIVIDGSTVPVGSGTVVDDPDGPFQFPVTVPPLSGGEYTVIVTDGVITLSNIVTSNCPVSSTIAPGKLPRTGSDSMSFVRIALALIAVGGLLLLAERRRRSADAV